MQTFHCYMQNLLKSCRLLDIHAAACIHELMLSHCLVNLLAQDQTLLSDGKRTDFLRSMHVSDAPSRVIVAECRKRWNNTISSIFQMTVKPDICSIDVSLLIRFLSKIFSFKDDEMHFKVSFQVVFFHLVRFLSTSAKITLNVRLSSHLLS